MSENPQPSQAAPIDEYRVLWTAQKKQKLKKWHDGFLRFHKFNKRLLVYDDARHLVADMYLRGRDTIDEGDDLEFENHLVTVEDFKGTVVQDLTPLFTSGVKRKQRIQAGNNLINPETPNQANRHGPWGPNIRNTTLTPYEGPTTTAVGFPQTPMQRRPTNTNISLKQSIRRNNNIKHPHPYQGRPQAQAQNHPTKIGPLPPPKSSVIQNPNPQIEQSWRSDPQRPDTSKFSTSRRPPLNTLDGPPSPNRRINQPPKQATPPEPAQNHRPPTGHKNAPSYSAPSHVDRGPLDLNGFSDVVRPLKPSLPERIPINIFSNPAPVNKSTPDVAIDTDSDDELFGSLPDFSIRASPPLAQKADLEPVCASKRSSDVSKNPDKNFRAFKPPSTRSAVIFPNKTSSTSRAALSSTGTGEGSNSRTFQSLTNRKPTIASSKPSLVVAVDTIPITSSGGGGEKEKGLFEPLVSAGTILLGGAAKRKRSKLLCQRPSSASPKGPSAGIRERESISKRPRKEPPSKLPSPPIVVERAAENSMATVDTSGDAPILPPPTVKKGLSAFKSQPPKKVHESKGDDKGKGVANHMQYRIEEKADTIEYQKEHDTGPWSSEAFDLFGWRPPSMREGRK